MGGRNQVPEAGSSKLMMLSRVGGSRAEAARLLGLKRTTLVQKIKRANLTDRAVAS